MSPRKLLHTVKEGSMWPFVCVCVCVCVRETERERKREREGERRGAPRTKNKIREGQGRRISHLHYWYSVFSSIYNELTGIF